MRFTKYFLTIAAILILSAAAFSQEKDDPMPANATQADAQAWFVKEMNRNFGYGTIDDSIKISDLKFDGCKMSYRMIQKYTDQKGALGDKPGLGDTGSVAAKEISYSVYEDVSFDLADLDPAAVALGALATPKNMQVISVATTGKKDLIKFDRKGSSVRYNASGMRPDTQFPIKDRAGEVLAKGFQHLINQCHAK